MSARPARCAAALLVLVSASARGQIPEHAVELFSTASLVGGFTPVSVGGHTRITPHGGVRVDGGIQGEQGAFGFGFRYWEAVRTGGVGTLGFDLFALGEWRQRRDSRTTIRVTTGFGSESVDDASGASLAPPSDDNAGIITWSIGVAHEVFVPAIGLTHLSADVIVPPVSSSGDGRRRPVIELGVGYRWRNYQHITMPNPRGRR